jgi:hypothetical protein
MSRYANHPDRRSHRLAEDLLADQAALPNTGLTTGAVLRIALLLLLIGVEVLITVGKREDEYSIATLPLSDS